MRSKKTNKTKETKDIDFTFNNGKGGGAKTALEKQGAG